MPKLNTLIEVGFCSGYGDGDYRVSSEIAEFDRAKFDELRLAILGALHCAENMWRSQRVDSPDCVQNTKPQPFIE